MDQSEPEQGDDLQRLDLLHDSSTHWRSMSDSEGSEALSEACDLLRDSEALQRRIALLDQPHIKPLTRFAEELSARSSAVPYFDPLDGGCEAKVLVLLESPARLASRPRFVSLDNPVPAQRNLKRFFDEAGLARRQSVLWNVFPWLPASDGPRETLTIGEIERGIGELPSLIGLLPDLRVIVLAGRKAQRAFSMLTQLPGSPVILTTPHPSPLAVCRFPDVATNIVETLKRAARVAASR
ncbi:uracil-DNA glycosylase [Caballeronia sp. HLA56]